LLQANRFLKPTNLKISKILLQYANAVFYFHTHSTFQQASPLKAVATVTTPILYIHGNADELVPAYMALELQQATKGPSEVFVFTNSTHGSAIVDDQAHYKSLVQNFIQTATQS